jgi:gentisate 1,2-dioxygenase
MGIAPDNGQHYRWKKGDLIVVDHYLWHQHFNDDPLNQCRLVRVHMFDSLLETMRTLMDPMVLFEEAEDTLVSMQELSRKSSGPTISGRAVMDMRVRRCRRVFSRCTCCPPSTTTATGTPSSSRAR